MTAVADQYLHIAATRSKWCGKTATLGVMARNRHDLRFIVQRADGYCSSPWRLWVTAPGDVYLAVRGMGGIEKYSFHQSGICRSAFTKEHGVPSTMKDRAIFKWVRAKTPFQGSGRASRIVWMAFPTDFLSRPSHPVPAKTLCIQAAPAGDATFIELAFTFESQNSVVSAFGTNGRRLHAYLPLPSGEALIVDSYCADWTNDELRSPPAPGSVFPELLFSHKDPEGTGRPVRIRFGPAPKDGDALVLQELGGYKLPAGTA